MTAPGYFRIPQAGEIRRQRAAAAAEAAPIQRSEDNVTEPTDDELYAALFTGNSWPTMTDDEAELYESLYPTGTPVSSSDDAR